MGDWLVTTSCPHPSNMAKSFPIIGLLFFAALSLAAPVHLAGLPTDPAGSCGTQPTPANCSQINFGTCGNACCKMQFTTTLNSDQLATFITKKLSAGGSDGGFALQPNAEGSVGLVHFPSINNIQYLGTAYHTTFGPAHYNDTINIGIFHASEVTPHTNSMIEVFSSSQIGGAYGDAGQNYKNIAMVVDELVLLNSKVLFGCRTA